MSRLAQELGLIIFLLYLPFYGLCIGLVCAAFAAARRGRNVLALLLAPAVTAPFVNYVSASVEARYEAPRARRAEVASWPRTIITEDNRPRVFVDTSEFASGFIPSTLVALGRFEKAYGLVGDDWYSFERVPSAACIESGKDERAILRRNPRVPNPCVTLTIAGRRSGKDLNIPEIAESYLKLLTDRDAFSGRTDNVVVAGSILELRLMSDEGGKLVSFWEAPYFQAPIFPPFTLGKGGWATDRFQAEHTAKPDVVEFVLDALNGA